MDDINVLSDSEIEIMEIIWSNNNSIFFGELIAKLEKINKNWKPNTVLTFLSRIQEKKLVIVKKHGRKNEYISVFSKKDYLDSITKNFVDKVYKGNAKDLLTSLIKKDFITKEDIKEIEDFWSEKEVL